MGKVLNPGAIFRRLTALLSLLSLQASAAKARKFQDAKSLKMSAQDLEVEIARLRRLGIS